MGLIGERVEDRRSYLRQLEQERLDTVLYHYKRVSGYYWTSPWRTNDIMTFKNNYNKVINDIGRNSRQSQDVFSRPNRFKRIEMKGDMSPQQMGEYNQTR